jgi:TatA/E family protein of Tat protein translocase
MPFNIGAPELIIILVIALLILGPGRLPEVGSSVGKAIREFRKASSDVEDAAKIDVSPLPTGTPAAPAEAVAAAVAAQAPAAPEAPVAAAPIQAAAAPSSEPTPGTN